ncbi:methyl-accepting chemotaxis protein [Rhizobium aquaticum]|uniref:Methyl-accepting chemotaxis protein n=1 Tax=Rhizobium aquaticum TaxID=1549636 RepID=A0ABV2J7D0_9HYPH
MFSIRNVLVSVFFVISLALGAVVSKSVLESYSAYNTFKKVAGLTAVDKALFDFLLNYRLERGHTNTAMITTPEKAGTTPQDIPVDRQKVDAAMKAIDKAIQAVDRPEFSAILAKTRTNYDTIVSMRAQIDAQLAMPLDSRNKDVNVKQMSFGATVLTDLETNAIFTESAIRALDNGLTDLLQIRGNAWAARAGAGAENIILNKAAASGAALPKADVVELIAQDAKVTASWLQVRALIDHPIVSNDLKQLLTKAEAAYFSGQIADTRDGMFKKAVAGEPVGVTLDNWLAPSSKSQAAIADVVVASMKVMDDKANELADGALSSVIAYGLLLLAALVVAIAGMVIVVRRVAMPIGNLTRCMQALADGDTQSLIPFTNRQDEIGGMAGSVEVFRQAAIRNKQLEAEADENRKLAEADRVEVQRRAEAEAQERLDRATGSLAAGLKRLAAGDMLCEIHEQFAPQFETLRADFNTSVSQLRAALLSVSNSAATVTNGSKEISDASDSLAKRTEQQAASLEETAAALEEITVNVVSTSKRAAEARTVVREARSHADHSGAVVRNAVTAMERIEQASQQISNIISVIDEIAFQTNLLALNAGVEAARAGDAGKGFAVVAQEVRELAQRSANAAKEIKALINNSTAAVSEGVKLVSDTGQGLNSIEQLVQVINTHMEAIATAAQEQSSGLAEVNTAVNHMDQATQQNAAMVEEMNAAGAGLAQESVNLADLLARFALGNDGQQLRNVASSMRAPSRAVAQRGRAGNAAAAPQWETF